jgi:hypothetical protein
LIFSAAAGSLIVAKRPASIVRRRRNARASALTGLVFAAERPRCVVPPGACTGFRPPRCFRTASGTRMVSIRAAQLRSNHAA